MPSLSKTARVPLRIDDSGNVIVLNVMLSGKRDSRHLKMVLDTGASITTIPAEAAMAIGCDPARSAKRIEMITASGIEYVPVVRIPKLHLMGFEFKNVETACLNLPPKSLVSGLLGLNVLSSFNLTLAFLDKFLELKN